MKNIEYDLLTKTYYWKLTDKDENKIVEDLIVNNFEKYIHSRKKKPIIRALSFLFLNLFMFIYEEDFKNDNFIRKCDLEYPVERLKELGYALSFTTTKSRTINYQYGEFKISHRTLIEIVKELEKDGWCINHEKGYCTQNVKKNDKRKYKLHFEYFNFSKIYTDLYIPFLKEINDDIVQCNHPSSRNEYIIKKNVNDKLVEIKKSEYKQYESMKEIIDTKKYIHSLKEMYNDMYFQLSLFEKMNEIQQKIVIDKFNEIKKWKYVDKEYFDSTLFNHFVIEKNKCLKGNSSPYRLFILNEEGNLNWGRVYRNCGLDNLCNMYKPSMKINDEFCISIDVKSSILQFYVLSECKDVDNHQDFYMYNSLVDRLTRDEVKMISQFMNNNKDILSAWRTYNSKSLFDKRFRKISYDDWYDIICRMYNEKRFLLNLWNNVDKCKEIISIESSFMMKLSSLLIEKNLYHLCNFDAIYVPYSSLNQVLDLFYSLSMDIFCRNIYVEYDKEIYSSLCSMDS